MFGIALLLVIVLPLAVTGIAYERAKRAPQPQLVAANRPRPARRPTNRAEAGMTTGVFTVLLLPCGLGLVPGDLSREWTYPVVIAVLILVPLAVWAIDRRRFRYAGGMAFGAAIAGIAVPVAFLLLISAVRLVIGWS